MAHINESAMPVTWKDLKNYFAWRSAEMQAPEFKAKQQPLLLPIVARVCRYIYIYTYMYMYMYIHILK